jgi:hypothetical protein
MPRAESAWAAQRVVAQRAAAQVREPQVREPQVREPQVVARCSLVEECLARADQCQDPARSHPCLGNPRPDREALPEDREDRPDREYQAKKAPQWILPERLGLAQWGGRQAWDRALPKGLARLEHRPDRAATDFSLSYRRQEVS